MKLSNLKQNQKAVITQISIQDTKIKRRICDLGLYSGEYVTLLKTSILKKTILISIKNYTLCLQSKIADCIQVKVD